jgi:hypothetical protein
MCGLIWAAETEREPAIAGVLQCPALDGQGHRRSREVDHDVGKKIDPLGGTGRDREVKHRIRHHLAVRDAVESTRLRVAGHVRDIGEGPVGEDSGGSTSMVSLFGWMRVTNAAGPMSRCSV